MQSSSTGPVRPVVEGEPSGRPRWQAAGAVALGALVVSGAVAWFAGWQRDGAVEETTVAVSVPTTTTTVVTTTVGATTTTTAAPTTTTTALAARGLDALGAFRAGPLPPEAVCPPGSTPDIAGDPSAPRPPLDSLYLWTSVALDRESGLLVLLVEDRTPSREHLLTTWTFDPCRNQWKQMESNGLAPGASVLPITYDADSDLMVGIDDGGVVWAYDTDTDTWTSITWTLNRPALPVGFTPLYHDPSGLIILFRFPEDAVWAYDIDTDGRYQLGRWDAPPGLLSYAPLPSDFCDYCYYNEGFYIFRFFSGPASTTWRWVFAEGWEQLNIATPSPPCVEAGDLFYGTLAFDEATRRALVFCGSTLFATFDPTVDEWEIAQAADQEGPTDLGSTVYDSANDRLIFLGPSMWAFDARTAEWIELLPAE